MVRELLMQPRVIALLCISAQRQLSLPPSTVRGRLAGGVAAYLGRQAPRTCCWEQAMQQRVWCPLHLMLRLPSTVQQQRRRLRRRVRVLAPTTLR
jgi:hypothetical protein